MIMENIVELMEELYWTTYGICVFPVHFRGWNKRFGMCKRSTFYLLPTGSL
jgi:hypothetical protein